MAKAKKKPSPAKKATKKPVKKAVKKSKPVAKKVVKPAKKKVAKPLAKKTKPVKKAAKPVVKKPAKTTAKAVKPVKVASKKESKPETKKALTAKAEPKNEILTKTTAGISDAPRRRGRKPNPKPENEKPSQPRIFDVVYVPVEPKPKPAPTFIPMRQMPDVKLPENKSSSSSSGKTRYSDKELQEFKQLIERKLADARVELDNLQAALVNLNEHGTDDTGTHFKMLEDGSEALAKEEAGQLAMRQRKYVEQLENALKRIENKTYGICRVTGNLIPKERLLAVPHTTQSIEAKMKQYEN
jgi:RNA polymerase-binding transcription factor DksA